MSRPRIRTLKPELAQDDDLGPISRDARYTFIGLITMADDEGRLRAQPAIILGHWFAYDTDAPRKLAGWLDEIEACGRIVRYAHEGRRYIAIRHFKRHQQINKPTPSKLPAPPDQQVIDDNKTPTSPVVLPDNSRSTTGALRENYRASRARGRNGTERNGNGTPQAPRGATPSGEAKKEFEEWLADHQRVTGHVPPATTTKAYRTLLEQHHARRAEGWTAEQIKLATRGAHADDHRRKNGYDTADSVLRPTKIAALVNRGQKVEDKPGRFSSKAFVEAAGDAA